MVVRKTSEAAKKLYSQLASGNGVCEKGKPVQNAQREIKNANAEYDKRGEKTLNSEQIRKDHRVLEAMCKGPKMVLKNSFALKNVRLQKVIDILQEIKENSRRGKIADVIYDAKKRVCEGDAHIKEGAPDNRAARMFKNKKCKGDDFEFFNVVVNHLPDTLLKGMLEWVKNNIVEGE